MNEILPGKTPVQFYGMPRRTFPGAVRVATATPEGYALAKD